MMVERIYLDTNVYCRPLDDQGDARVRAESSAFLGIVDFALRREVVIVSSDYVRFEIERILDPVKRKDVRGFERVLSKVRVASSKRLVTFAEELSTMCRLNSLDALHIAAACFGRADLVLTCDNEILRKGVCVERLAAREGHRLKVRNPVSYLKERRR